MKYAPCLAFFIALGIVGCGDSANGHNPDGRAGANAEPATLFSESLHDLPMPGPGRAWVEFQGEAHEVELSPFCTAITEPSPDHPWEPQMFTASSNYVPFGGEMATLNVQRLIHPDESWGVAGHEQEIVGLTMQDGFYNYSMYRLTPGDPAMISRPLHAPARTAGTDDSVPGIRVHADGRQATFVGVLGQGSMIEELDDPAFEEIRIAIHCGPG